MKLLNYILAGAIIIFGLAISFVLDSQILAISSPFFAMLFLIFSESLT
ncbi:hypothetical protein M2125_000999 [Polynucleobacter sphagniphilus]|nr:hypothetical protein [Polynucleobacter sphagniphilus]